MYQTLYLHFYPSWNHHQVQTALRSFKSAKSANTLKKRTGRNLSKPKIKHFYVPFIPARQKEIRGREKWKWWWLRRRSDCKKVIICMEERLLWESALINLKGRGRWQMTGDDRYSRRAWQPRPIWAQKQHVLPVMDVCHSIISHIQMLLKLWLKENACWEISRMAEINSGGLQPAGGSGPKLQPWNC